jgi:hypothetical protein
VNCVAERAVEHVAHTVEAVAGGGDREVVCGERRCHEEGGRGDGHENGA